MGMDERRPAREGGEDPGSAGRAEGKERQARREGGPEGQ